MNSFVINHWDSTILHLHSRQSDCIPLVQWYHQVVNHPKPDWLLSSIFSLTIIDSCVIKLHVVKYWQFVRIVICQENVKSHRGFDKRHQFHWIILTVRKSRAISLVVSTQMKFLNVFSNQKNRRFHCDFIHLSSPLPLISPLQWTSCSE